MKITSCKSCMYFSNSQNPKLLGGWCHYCDFSLMDFIPCRYYEEYIPKKENVKKLHENPKLTRQEREFLEVHKNIYLARNKDGSLWLYTISPSYDSEVSWWKVNRNITEMLEINRKTFKFITWKSGKYWSKRDLMKLEVID